MTPPSSAIVALLAANGLLFAALLISPSAMSHRYLAAAFLPLILMNNFHAWQGGLGFFSVVQSFWATELLLFRNPREDFKILRRRKGRSDTKDPRNSIEYELWKEPYPESLWNRVWWVTKLGCSHRFIGWDTGGNRSQFETREAERGLSRGKWLLWRFLSAIWCFLVVDAVNSYQAVDPYFRDGLHIDAPLPSFLTGFLGGSVSYWFMPRTIRTIAFGLQQYCIFSLTGSLPAIVCVSLGGVGVIDDFWGNPLNWPPLMGNPFVIIQSGLCGFWGKVWHQLFRNVGSVALNKRVDRSADDIRYLLILARHLDVL